MEIQIKNEILGGGVESTIVQEYLKDGRSMVARSGICALFWSKSS